MLIGATNAQKKLDLARAAATQPTTLSTAEVDALRSEITRLRAENTALKKELAAIKAGATGAKTADSIHWSKQLAVGMSEEQAASVVESQKLNKAAFTARIKQETASGKVVWYHEQVGGAIVVELVFDSGKAVSRREGMLLRGGGVSW
jgi:hypothetical protein